MANGRGDDFTPLVRLMRTINSIHYPTRFAQVFFSKKAKKFPAQDIVPCRRGFMRCGPGGRSRFPAPPMAVEKVVKPLFREGFAAFCASVVR